PAVDPPAHSPANARCASPPCTIGYRMPKMSVTRVRMACPSCPWLGLLAVVVPDAGSGARYQMPLQDASPCSDVSVGATPHPGRLGRSWCRPQWEVVHLANPVTLSAAKDLSDVRLLQREIPRFVQDDSFR